MIILLLFADTGRPTSADAPASIMDSHVGLDYIVDNPDYCVKLASGKLLIIRFRCHNSAL